MDNSNTEVSPKTAASFKDTVRKLMDADKTINTKVHNISKLVERNNKDLQRQIESLIARCDQLEYENDKHKRVCSTFTLPNASSSNNDFFDLLQRLEARYQSLDDRFRSLSSDHQYLLSEYSQLKSKTDNDMQTTTMWRKSLYKEVAEISKYVLIQEPKSSFQSTPLPCEEITTAADLETLRNLQQVCTTIQHDNANQKRKLDDLEEKHHSIDGKIRGLYNVADEHIKEIHNKIQNLRREVSIPTILSTSPTHDSVQKNYQFQFPYLQVIKETYNLPSYVPLKSIRTGPASCHGILLSSLLQKQKYFNCTFRDDNNSIYVRPDAVELFKDNLRKAAEELTVEGVTYPYGGRLKEVEDGKNQREVECIL